MRRVVGTPGEKVTLANDEPREARRFGNYEVLSRIGSGGMAEIFKCRLTGIGGFDKIVVVKRMLPDLLGDPELVRMFLDEARIAAGLSHPNIVQTFEVNQLDGNPYIVMEYARGPTLSTVIREAWKQGKPCAKIAAKVMSEVAGALAHVHEACDARGQPLGIVHRDVTPHNVVVTTEGVAKLLDFGVAKAAGRLSKTNAGSIKGKFRYMAPEQLHAGDAVDGRADVFAVGACLYLAAAGVHAYSSQSDVEVLKAALAGVYLPPSTFNPSIDPELERLILWAMAPNLAVRCPSALALHELLDGYVSQGGERVTNLQVARFVRQLFGDFSNSGAFGGAYNDEVRSGDFGLPRGSGVSVGAAIPPELRLEPVEVELADLEPIAPASPQPAAQVAAAPPAPPEPASAVAERPRSKRLVLALAMVALGLLGLVVFWSRSGERRPPRIAPAMPPPRAEAQASAGPAPSRQAPPERVEAARAEPPAVKAPRVGRLTVVTDAPARVLVDGQVMGSSPLRAQALTAERHQVEVQAYGFPAQGQAVVVAPDKEVHLAFHFARRHAEPPSVRIAPAPVAPPRVPPAAAAIVDERAPKAAEREMAAPVVARAEEPVHAAPVPKEAGLEEPQTAAAPPIAPLNNPARDREAKEGRPAAAVRAAAAEGPIASCPEGASLAGAAPPAGTSLWCQIPSGVKHGKYLRWYANGVRAETGDFVNGKKNGRWLEFYADGSEREKTEWRRGVKTW
jgi:serine/threonine-protein kinase